MLLSPQMAHLWILMAIYQLVVLVICIFGEWFRLDIGGWPVVLQIPLLALIMMYLQHSRAVVSDFNQ